jgi:hypothetical protein
VGESTLRMYLQVMVVGNAEQRRQGSEQEWGNFSANGASPPLESFRISIMQICGESSLSITLGSVNQFITFFRRINVNFSTIFLVFGFLGFVYVTLPET